MSLAEAGGAGQRQDWPNLAAQEQDGNDDEDDGGCHHPGQEDVGIRSVGPILSGGDAENTIALKRNADLHRLVVAGRIEPEWPVDLRRDLPAERAVKDGIEWGRRVPAGWRPV